MSKRRRSTKAKRTFSQETEVFFQRIFQKNYPNDPRYLYTGWVMLIIGVILWFQEPHFIWSGWVQTLINWIDPILIGMGTGLILCTTLGIAQRK